MQPLRQGPAGEGACAAQVWRGVKIAPGEVVALLNLPPTHTPPSFLPPARRGAACGAAGLGGGGQEAKPDKTPAPAGERVRAKAEPSPLKAMRGSRGLHPPFPGGVPQAPGDRGLRPVPVPRRPGRSGGWRRLRGGTAAATLPSLNIIRRPGEPPWFEGVFVQTTACMLIIGYSR